MKRRTARFSSMLAGRMVRSAALLLPLVAGSAMAEELDTLFLPSEIKSYNHSQSFTTLSNEDLAIRADQIRYNRITPSQRAMNYQWLSEHSGAEDPVHGEKAVTKLLERHLKAYIDERAGGRWIKQKLMPETNNDGFIKAVDYDVKLRANRMAIGITYEF